VAHVGQEQRLGACCRFGRVLCLPERFLRALSRGDVPVGADEPQRSARFVALRYRVGFDVARAAVLQQNPELHLVPALVGQELAQCAIDLFQVVRMGTFVPECDVVVSTRRIDVVELVHDVIPVDDASNEVPAPNTDFRAAGGHLQTLRDSRQRAFGALELGDVDQMKQHARLPRIFEMAPGHEQVDQQSAARGLPLHAALLLADCLQRREQLARARLYDARIHVVRHPEEVSKSRIRVQDSLTTGDRQRTRRRVEDSVELLPLTELGNLAGHLVLFGDVAHRTNQVAGLLRRVVHGSDCHVTSPHAARIRSHLLPAHGVSRANRLRVFFEHHRERRLRDDLVHPLTAHVLRGNSGRPAEGGIDRKEPIALRLYAQVVESVPRMVVHERQVLLALTQGGPMALALKRNRRKPARARREGEQARRRLAWLTVIERESTHDLLRGVQDRRRPASAELKRQGHVAIQVPARIGRDVAHDHGLLEVGSRPARASVRSDGLPVDGIAPARRQARRRGVVHLPVPHQQDRSHHPLGLRFEDSNQGV